MRQRDLKFTFVVGEGKLAFDVVEFELEEALCEPFRLRRLSGVSADTACGGIRPTHPGNAGQLPNSVGRITARGYPPLIRDIGG